MIIYMDSASGGGSGHPRRYGNARERSGFFEQSVCAGLGFGHNDYCRCQVIYVSSNFHVARG